METERDLLVGSLPRCLQQLGLGRMTPIAWNSIPISHMCGRDLTTELSLLSPRLCVSREQELERRWQLNPGSDTQCGRPKWHLNHCLKCLRQDIVYYNLKRWNFTCTIVFISSLCKATVQDILQIFVYIWGLLKVSWKICFIFNTTFPWTFWSTYT